MSVKLLSNLFDVWLNSFSFPVDLIDCVHEFVKDDFLRWTKLIIHRCQIIRFFCNFSSTDGIKLSLSYVQIHGDQSQGDMDLLILVCLLSPYKGSQILLEQSLKYIYYRCLCRQESHEAIFEFFVSNLETLIKHLVYAFIRAQHWTALC